MTAFPLTFSYTAFSLLIVTLQAATGGIYPW